MFVHMFPFYHLQRQTKTKARDMAETGIELELLHFPPADGSGFNMSAFYQDVLAWDDVDSAAVEEPSERFEELLTR